MSNFEKKCTTCGEIIEKTYVLCPCCGNWTDFKRGNRMMKFFLIITLLSVSSCASDLLKQSPPLAKHERFYKFSEEVGVIFHNRCKKLEGRDRKCTKTFYNVEEMWSIFYPGYIIIPQHKVFK